MGAGKTTIGKALSKELGMMFYDLDWYIETRMHRTVAQIFAEKGEEGFRKIERPLIKGKSPEELQQFIVEQLKKREPYYNKAKHHLDVSLMDNYEKIKISVDEVKKLLGR